MNNIFLVMSNSVEATLNQLCVNISHDGRMDIWRPLQTITMLLKLNNFPYSTVGRNGWLVTLNEDNSGDRERKLISI